jgi:hypothetical protein
MSAFIVRKKHIDYVVTAAVAAKAIPASEADETGRMLWRENLNSVAHRYPRDTGKGDRPGPRDFQDSDVETYVWEETAVLKGNSLRETIGCLNYQSCEHPGWHTSEAYQLLELLKPAEDKSPRGKQEENATPWGW